ncbi:MAG: M24 family metallopeptidase [Nanoarchaeota archaeon]
MDKVNFVRKACSINDVIFKEIIKNFNFKTEKDIVKYIKKRFRNFKVKQAFPTIAANNNKTIHAKPRNKKLERGFLILDFGCKYKSYCSDMTRTIFLGKPNKYEKMLYNLILNCENKCIKKLKINYPYCDLEIYSRLLLKNYKQYFLHSLGHGIGKKIHDLPRISIVSNDKVKKNEIITIEPGIYFKRGNKETGIRIEDTVYIGKKIEVLSNSNKELVSLKI